MNPRRRPVLVRAVLVRAGLALALALATAGPSLAQSLDPFYTSLLSEGIQTLQEGDPRGAASALRTACFGLLDEPVTLGRCLAHLGVAQGEIEDREAFAETFRKLVQVEQRFGGYTKADVPPAMRARLETWLVRWVPEEQLASLPAFRDLAARRVVAKLQRQPPREQRSELTTLLGREPANPVYRLALAELDLSEGKTAEAVAGAEAVLAAQPGFAQAQCFRGLALARQGKACPRVVTDLTTCQDTRLEPVLAAALLACRLELGQVREAEAWLATLPREVREDREVNRLARQLERTPAPKPSPSPATTAPATTSPTKTPEPDPKATPPNAATTSPATTNPATTSPVAPPPAPVPAPALAATPSAEDRQQMQRLREQLRGVRSATELGEPLRLATELAERYPTHAESQLLAGEVAYRASRWADAARFFKRGGDPGGDRPDLLFYMAVAYFETGDKVAAASALERALPKLERTPFVEGYRRRILPEAPAGKTP